MDRARGWLSRCGELRERYGTGCIRDRLTSPSVAPVERVPRLDIHWTQARQIPDRRRGQFVHRVFTLLCVRYLLYDCDLKFLNHNLFDTPHPPPPLPAEEMIPYILRLAHNRSQVEHDLDGLPAPGRHLKGLGNRVGAELLLPMAVHAMRNKRLDIHLTGRQ